MTVSNGLAIVAATWLVIGFSIAFVMRRRGHDFWVWAALGCVLGPLAVPLAIERGRYHSIEYQSPDVRDSHGSFDVLVGIDGSAESIAAAKEALLLFGGWITSMTLAKVLDYDSGGSYTGAESRAAAIEELRSVASELRFEPTLTRLLFGRADEALMEYARGAGVDLIVVGACGHGLSERLFGSVTSRLVGGCDVPVFVGPRRRDADMSPGEKVRRGAI
ncbi:MAG TPA: universal stress protein [Acidimicrobiia bacterium]